MTDFSKDITFKGLAQKNKDELHVSAAIHHGKTNHDIGIEEATQRIHAIIQAGVGEVEILKDRLETAKLAGTADRSAIQLQINEAIKKSELAITEVDILMSIAEDAYPDQLATRKKEFLLQRENLARKIESGKIAVKKEGFELRKEEDIHAYEMTARAGVERRINEEHALKLKIKADAHAHKLATKTAE